METDTLRPKVRRMYDIAKSSQWDVSLEQDGGYTAIVCSNGGVRMKIWFNELGLWSLDGNHRGTVIRADGTMALLRNAGSARMILDPGRGNPVALELVRSKPTGSMPSSRQWRSLPWRDNASIAEISRHLHGPIALMWRDRDGTIRDRVPPEGSVRPMVVQSPGGARVCLVWAEEGGVWSVAVARMLRCERVSASDVPPAAV